MSGKTMKLLRRTASKTKADYKQLKAAYKQAPAPLRAQGKRMMSDIVAVERQHKELAKDPKYQEHMATMQKDLEREK